MNQPASAAENMATEKAALRGAMEKQSLIPLWEVYEKIVTREPSMAVPSHIWKWEELKEAVALTVKTVHGKDADHRVLVLKNPAMQGKPATATNMIGAVQCVMPGEKTSPHRHTPAAVRFVLEGKGGGTFVDGQRCAMHTGDFIITPNWTWHGHHNDSDSPVIWVDILDVPLVQHANAVFGEYSGENGPAAYPENTGTLPDELFVRGGLEPVTDRPAVPYSPRFHYAWQDVLALLATMPAAADGSRAVRYSNPLRGGAVIATLDATVTEIAKGMPTRRIRSTASQLCVVIEGSGSSKVGDATHQWQARDIFTVPEWQWLQHTAASDTARLLLVSDRGVREGVGLYREERA
ncbi:MAG: cupin domain-containing protein [Betaproteobacteria bacterium]|nr:cupin domain-containing protein [Betaproteobacteria bacterium]